MARERYLIANDPFLYRDKLIAVLGDGRMLYNYNLGESYIDGMFMGSVYKEVDGYYHWDPAALSGIWSENLLQVIVNILKDLNKEWDKEVREALAHD